MLVVKCIKGIHTFVEGNYYKVKNNTINQVQIEDAVGERFWFSQHCSDADCYEQFFEKVK